MATKVYLRNVFGTFGLGTDTANEVGSNVGWSTFMASTTPGTPGAFTASSGNTVNGATNGIEVLSNTFALEFFSEPFAADVTISGTITFNVWMAESNMSANVGAQVIVEKVSATGVLTTISNSEKGTELPVTTRAAQNWTATPTSTVMNRGDRLRMRVLGNDAGTMATGFTFSLSWDNGTAAADGDTYVQFNETITFESDPAGTTVYLTTTASDISGGNEAWTSRGAASTNAVTNTAAGWTAPIQITDTAGGSVLQWYTKQLAAFTLGGKTKVNVRAKASALTTRAQMKAEIAIVNSDGSGATTWGSACMDISSGAQELTTTDAAYSCWVSGDDTAVTNGQRLRIRLFVDDENRNPLVTGRTVTTTYAGTSGGAAGDTYVTLQQSVSEFVVVDTGEWKGCYPPYRLNGTPNILYAPER